MTDVWRLTEAFERGDLVRPSADEPGLVDLALALADRADVPGVSGTAHSAALAERIGVAEHLVFVLVDGLGDGLLESEPSAEFMRAHRTMVLRSTFPSTTAVALTSMATGAWPARHGILGWWTYLPSLGDSVTVLPFARRLDDAPLDDLGVAVEELFALPSMWARGTRDATCIQPARIAGSIYSSYAHGGRTCTPYGSLRQAFDAVIAHVLNSDGPTYSYLYLPQVDGAAHEHGLRSPEVRGAITGIDRELARCAERLEGVARIVLTSDHGHLEAPPERRHPIREEDALGRMLDGLPSGDLRAPVFRIIAGQSDAFAAAFRERFGDRFALLTPGEIDDLRLLGPEPLTEETRARLGNFMAISLGSDIFAFLAAGGESHAMVQPSHHSGMSPQEVLVPLVVA